MKRRILITSLVLGARSGAELFTQELARACVLRGHEVAAFSRRLGRLSEQMRVEGVRVCRSLDELPWRPDVIHAQHALEALAAIGRFPDVPALYLCHDAAAWFDAAPPLPSIRRYVAVDELCRARVARDAGVPVEQVAVILNSVDLDLFAPRAAPLPQRPQRALLFSRGATDLRHAEAVREACRNAGIPLDTVGKPLGPVVERPWEVLPRYDLVFAKGRCALEALAVGCAVILVGPEGVGPLVRPESFDASRRLNFGRGLLYAGDFGTETLRRELLAYDPASAARVQARVRALCGRDAMVDAYLSLYEELLADPPPLRQDPLVAYLGTLAHEASRWSYPFGRRRRRKQPTSLLSRAARRLRTTLERGRGTD